jgi:hypothetical protein
MDDEDLLTKLQVGMRSLMRSIKGRIVLTCLIGPVRLSSMTRKYHTQDWPPRVDTLLMDIRIYTDKDFKMQ